MSRLFPLPSSGRPPELGPARLNFNFSVLMVASGHLLLSVWWLRDEIAQTPTLGNLLARPDLTGPPLTLTVVVAALLGALPGPWPWRVARAAAAVLLGTLGWANWPITPELSVNAPWPGLLLCAALGVASLQRLRDPQQTLPLGAVTALRRLQPELRGWTVRRHPDWPACSRHLITPAGKHLILHVSAGKEKGTGDAARVTWQSPTEPQLARRNWPADGILWVALGSRTSGHYTPEPWIGGGGYTYPARPGDFADHLFSTLSLKPSPRVRKAATDAGPKRRTSTGFKVPKTRSDKDIRARGQTFLADTPGLLGNVSAQPLVQRGPGVFELTSGHSRIVVAVWPHPDPPAPAHPDWGLYHGLYQALHGGTQGILWAPLLSGVQGLEHAPLAFTVPVQVVCGPPPVLAALLKHLERPTSTGPEPEPPPPPRSGVSRQPHEVLGVGPQATPEEIKAAWRGLAKQYHPDRVSSLGEELRVIAEARMKEINAAYEDLRP